MSDLPLPALLITGFVAGLFGSLLGLGGGWLMVPAMTAAGMSAVQSVGSSLAAMVATSLVSTIRYQRRGLLQVRLGLAFGIPSACGVYLGKHILLRLRDVGAADSFVGAFYVGLLLLLGSMMIRAKKNQQAGDRPSPARRLRLPRFGPVMTLHGGIVVYYAHAALGGMTAGILSGILGIGGGILLVPLMTGAFGLPVLMAVATSLVSVLVSATCGALSYGLAGDWSPAAAAWLAVGALAGGLTGTELAPYAEEKTLRRMFAALTAITASSLVAKLVGYREKSMILLFAGATVMGVVSLLSLLRSRAQKQGPGFRKTPASTDLSIRP